MIKFFEQLPVLVCGGYAHIGDTVIKYNANGCMASNWEFRWIGQIEKFERNVKVYGSGRLHTRINVKIMRRADLAHDFRDQDLGLESFLAEDTNYQLISPHLVMAGV